MQESRQNIRTLDKDQLATYFEQHGEKRFRAGQVYDWLWVHHARSFEDMTNLPKQLRQSLEKDFSLPALSVDTVQYSEDGTVKSRFRLHDGYFIEGVLIPTASRQTACVSSQVGCSLSCKFCATGFLPRKRNLHFDEIFDEVTILNKQSLEQSGRPLTNIVYMGMGEPLLNYKNVLRSIEKITAPDALGMSPRRITVSTAGIAKMIRQLGEDKVRFNLALSLHAANDRKRSEIMDINNTNSLKVLVEELNGFYKNTRNDITFEYILFKNFNDSLRDADELIKIYRQVPVKTVNLIEYNPVEKTNFAKPDDRQTEAFMDYLSRHRVNVRLRRSRGKDIDAACGQLANK
jgi:23S rRNA (adenine2503-C2)-methyltransferase